MLSSLFLIHLYCVILCSVVHQRLRDLLFDDIVSVDYYDCLHKISVLRDFLNGYVYLFYLQHIVVHQLLLYFLDIVYVGLLET